MVAVKEGVKERVRIYNSRAYCDSRRVPRHAARALLISYSTHVPFRSSFRHKCANADPNLSTQAEIFEQNASISPTSQLCASAFWLTTVCDITDCFPYDSPSGTLKDKGKGLAAQTLRIKCHTATPVWSTHGSTGFRSEVLEEYPTPD